MKKTMVLTLVALLAVVGTTLRGDEKQALRAGGQGEREAGRPQRAEMRQRAMERQQARARERAALEAQFDEMETGEWIAAWRKHHLARSRENAALRKEWQKNRIAAIRARDDLSPEQKKAMIQRLQARHRQHMAFHKELQDEAAAFYDGLAKNEGMERQEARDAIQRFNEEQRRRIRDWRTEQRAEAAPSRRAPVAPDEEKTVRQPAAPERPQREGRARRGMRTQRP